MSTLLNPDTRVLIVGAGISGLTLASSLAKSDICPVVVEVRPDAMVEGVGLLVWPHAVAILKQLGLDRPVVNAGIVRNRTTVLDNTANTRRVIDLTQENTSVAPNLGIERAALVNALKPESGLDLRLGLSIECLTPSNEGVSVRFTDGTVQVFDFVVGADGLRSRVRSLLFPKVVPSYIEVNAWRTLILRHPSDEPEMVVRQKGGLNGLTIPVSQRHVYVSFHRRGLVERDLPVERHFELFSELCAEFQPSMGDLPGRISDPAQIVFNAMYEVAAPVWWHENVVLVGDAAHAMPPFGGLGVSTALEDVAVLLSALSQAKTYREAFALYEAKRAPRARGIRRYVHALGMSGCLVQPKSEEDAAIYRELLSDHPATRRWIVTFSVD